MPEIRIIIGEDNIRAELNDTDTARNIFDALPLEAAANRWGDELYFGIPVNHQIEDGIEVLEEGDLAFWPPGSAFCIFFGPTPASTDSRPRAAGPVTVIGRLCHTSDLAALKDVPDGQKIRLER